MDTLVVLSNTPHPLDPRRATGRARSALAAGSGHPRPPTIPAACRGPRTGAGSRSPRSTWPSWGRRHDGDASKESARDPARARCDLVLPGRARGGRSEIAAGETFRIVDLEGNQAADTLFYNRHDLDERYSATETIRAQGNIYLTTGTALMSSEGRPLLAIVADTCGRHDTLGGACSAESNQVRYALEKKYMHNCRDSFVLALARYGHGTSKRDLPANINFFMNVPVTPAGALTFADGVSGPGRYVEMRGQDATCWR